MVKLHPLTMTFFSLSLLFMILAYSHPLYIVSILIFMVLNIVLSGHIEQLKRTIKYGLFTAVLIIIINPLVSQSGRTIVFSGPRIPVLGKIRITAEALAFGGNMALKLFCILLIFLLYDVMTDKDDTFSFLSRYIHKLTLIMSMTVNIIHRLSLEIMRVKDVMILRGVNFNEKNLFKRIKAYYPILKVILISSLEGSLDRAEALYSKGYGKHKRTFYSPVKMKTLDCIFIAINITLICLFIYGLFLDIGSYDFYPVLNGFDHKDLIYLLFINLILFVFLLIIWGCKRWKYLKYRI